MSEEEEDEVWTDLFGGRRVTKDNIRVDLCGDIDEANSALGLARATIKNRRVSDIIYKIQKELFIVGAECATLVRDLHKLPIRITKDHIHSLKKLYAEMKRSVPPVKGFITPGNSFPSANLHLARTIIRRAERIAVKLRREGKISKNIVDYLDVLSDLIFFLAVFEEESGKKLKRK
ncbi:MAG: cob(I)yrinic acid a,c-diamide adenosyltransferase [Candidatus Bathyarchaeia archaeon]